MNNRYLCLACGFLLLLAIPSGWPYAFYSLLRWVVSLSALVVAVGFYKSQLSAWTFIFGGVCLLFNPIDPIYLDKSSWVAIDFVSSILFFLAGFSFNNKKNK